MDLLPVFDAIGLDSIFGSRSTDVINNGHSLSRCFDRIVVFEEKNGRKGKEHTSELRRARPRRSPPSFVVTYKAIRVYALINNL